MAFMIRPNERTLGKMDEYEADIEPGIPPFGHFSIHIRHGDMQARMQLHEFQEYVAKALEMMERDDVPQIVKRSKTVFVSSESYVVSKKVRNATLMGGYFTG